MASQEAAASNYLSTDEVGGCSVHDQYHNDLGASRGSGVAEKSCAFSPQLKLHTAKDPTWHILPHFAAELAALQNESRPYVLKASDLQGPSAPKAAGQLLRKGKHSHPALRPHARGSVADKLLRFKMRGA